MEKTEVLLCSCRSEEHQILIHHYPEEQEVIFSYHLNSSDGFWSRLRKGLRYIFGYKCRYGHWDEIILTPQHIPQFQRIIESLTKKDGT